MTGVQTCALPILLDLRVFDNRFDHQVDVAEITVGHTSASPATPVASSSTLSSAASSSQIPQKRPRAEEESASTVVVKKRRPWSEEVDGGNRTHPWDCTGMVQRYTKLKNVPEELKKCEQGSSPCRGSCTPGIQGRAKVFSVPGEDASSPLRLSLRSLRPADFYQRTRLFSLYNELPMLLDTEGWFSVTPERIAIQIAERLRCGSE